MVARTDFSVDFEQSPRLVEITSASLAVSVQDSHDTLADIQDSSEGGQYEFLVSTTGGEDLGGGTTVGLTTVLNNAQYAFQATSPLSVGSVTTGSATHLIDSSATFVTDLVKRGDWIINFTDQSVTEIIEVVSETSLLTRGLRNGTANTFSISDAYKVWEVLEAEMSGGNFTAVDSVQADIAPVFPVFGRTFRLTASSSATATSQLALEAGLLAGKVVISVSNGFPGTDKNVNGDLIGTFRAPSSNLVDALQIAVANGIRTFIFTDDITINEDLSLGYVLQGVSPLVVLTADDSADMTNAAIENLTVIGQLDGMNSLTHCGVEAISDVSGLLQECSIRDNIAINDGVLLFNCISNKPGGAYPSIYGTAGAAIQVRDFHGSLGVDLIVDGSHTLEGNGGRCVIESGCTGGSIHVRGEWFELVDNSGVGCTVIDERSSLTVAEKLKLAEMHARLDLETTKPNTYANDLSTITNTDFTLTQTDNGNGTSTVQRS